MKAAASCLLLCGCLAWLYEAARRVVYGSAWDLSGAPIGLWLRRRGNRKDDSRFIDRTPIVRKKRQRGKKKEAKAKAPQK